MVQHQHSILGAVVFAVCLPCNTSRVAVAVALMGQVSSQCGPEFDTYSLIRVGLCMLPRTTLSLAAFREESSPGAATSSVLDFMSFSSWSNLLVLRGGRLAAAAGVGLTTAWSVKKKITYLTDNSWPHGYVPSLTGQRITKWNQALLFLFVAWTGLLLRSVPSPLVAVGPADAVEGATVRQGSFSPQDGQNLKEACSLSPHCEQKLRGILQWNEGTILMECFRTLFIETTVHCRSTLASCLRSKELRFVVMLFFSGIYQCCNAFLEFGKCYKYNKMLQHFDDSKLQRLSNIPRSLTLWDWTPISLDCNVSLSAFSKKRT